MEIKNITSRLVIERTDNGVILYDVNEEDTVVSKIVYELYYKDGLIDFENIAIFVKEIMEAIKIPLEEPETNSKFEIYLDKLVDDLDDEDKEDDDDDE